MSDARSKAQVQHCTVAEQIEFWAALGRAVEAQLPADNSSMLLSKCLAEVDSPVGSERLKRYLSTLPFPHYEPLPNRTEFFVRIDADGKRTAGRFVGRRFEEHSEIAVSQ